MLKRNEKFTNKVFGVFEKDNRDQIREKILDPRVSLALKCPEVRGIILMKIWGEICVFSRK